MNKTIIEPRLRPELLPQVCLLDLQNYNLSHPENWLRIAEQRPENYTTITRGDNLLGYSLVFPLKKAAYEALRAGRIGDFELQLKDLSEEPAGFYVASVASSMRIRGRFPFLGGLLVGLVGAQTIKTPKEVIAIPVSRTGKNLAEILGCED